MKISKRTREQAALICAVLASMRSMKPCAPMWCWESSSAGVALGLPPTSWRLARLAWFEAVRTEQFSSARYAEAEALLRTGWSPS